LVDAGIGLGRCLADIKPPGWTVVQLFMTNHCTCFLRELIMKLHRVTVQIHPPKEDYPGMVEEAHYTITNGVVTLVDSAGVPILDRYGKPFEKKFPPLGDAHAIAGRLAKEAWHARGGGKQDFWRPLTYKTVNY
jgi:hypothetical protein